MIAPGPQQHAGVPLSASARAERAGGLPEEPAEQPARGSTRRAELPDRYTIEGYTVFLDPDGVPAICAAVGHAERDRSRQGGHLWKVPLGEYPQLVAKGIRNTGTHELRRRRRDSGRTSCSSRRRPTKRFAPSKQHRAECCGSTSCRPAATRRPASTCSTAGSTSSIAAGGGGKNATKSGDSIVAFALPAGGRYVAAARDCRNAL